MKSSKPRTCLVASRLPCRPILGARLLAKFCNASCESLLTQHPVGLQEVVRWARQLAEGGHVQHRRTGQGPVLHHLAAILGRSLGEEGMHKPTPPACTPIGRIHSTTCPADPLGPTSLKNENCESDACFRAKKIQEQASCWNGAELTDDIRPKHQKGTNDGGGMSNLKCQSTIQILARKPQCDLQIETYLT